MFSGSTVNVVHPSAARTATRTDYLGGTPLTDIASTHGQLAGATALTAVVVVSAQSGTTPTLDVVVQGSIDGTNWFTLATVAQFAAATGTKTANMTAGTVIPPYIKAVSTIAGTTPSFTYTISVLAA